MVAGVHALEHAADEAVGQASSSGMPPGPGRHAQRSNLSTSSPVSPPNSSTGPPPAPGTKWTASSSACDRDSVAAVLVREADEEARRVDARLRREADQAARALPPRAGRHDEHRVVEVADQRVERRLRVHRRDGTVAGVDVARFVTPGL